jgi:hypothetical protein
MEADYGVISFLLHTLGLFGLISLKRVEEILSYFVSWSRKSLDFITEAKNADILYQHNLKHSSSIIPKQYLEFCTSRVITQEFIADTISLEDVIKYKKEEGGLAEGIDALGVVECFLNDELREYLIDGFFHATPHSSNLVFTKDFTTVHLDFGIIGEASGKRTILLGILKNISQKDTEGFCKHIFEFGSKILQDEMEYYLKADLTKRRQEEKILEKIKESIFEDFKKDAGDILNNWFVYLDHKDASIKDKMAIYTFAKIFGKLAAYGIYLPREINLFLRAIFLIDFIGLVTSEKYNLVNSLADFFTRYPQETLERYIVTGEYSGEIRQKLIPMAEMDWEFFKESAASEKERIMAARERIAELIAYYGEKYEEIGSMIKKIN